MGRKRSGVTRIAISLPPKLAARLDDWVERRNSKSRSDAIRLLVNRELAESERVDDPDADSLAALLLLYRHDAPNVLRRLARAEHRWGEHVRSSTHVHLEGGACAELLLLAGRRDEVERASTDLRGVKGLREGRALIVLPEVAGGATGHRHPHATSNRGRTRVRRTSS